MKVAIVILNWNGKEMMKRFLHTVVEHSEGAEVVVADNGSNDGSLEWLRSNGPQVRTICLDRNYGFAEGYNKALREVEAEYYVLLNSDVEVREAWLQPLLSFMDAHPDVAACQPKLLCQWQTESFEYAGASGGFLDSLGYPYCRGRVFSTVEKDEHQYDEAIPCHWATGACLLVRSKDYWAVGGLDYRFFAHQEEIDLCWRLRARGRAVACVPQSVVYHVGGGTLPSDSPRKTLLNFRNNLLMLYKNLPQRRLCTVLCLRFFLDALASLTFLFKGQWGSAIAVPKAWWAFFFMKVDFKPDRLNNLRVSVCEPLRNAPGSILWQYYVRGRKTWKQIVTPTLH